MTTRGFVYLLCAEDGWCKIGKTKKPLQRLKKYKNRPMNKVDPELPIYLLETNRHSVMEKQLHAIFDKKRSYRIVEGVCKNFEWFELDADDIEEFRIWAEIIVDNFDGKLIECHKSWNLLFEVLNG